jgi:4-hydroxy-3-polyprenylbenzoate decarboxylase
MKQPVTLAITGASGSVYGAKTLAWLINNDFHVDLILSTTAFKVCQVELSVTLESESSSSVKDTLLRLIKEKGWLLSSKEPSVRVWSNTNLAASISSGSFQSKGMIISPCSVGTMSRIAGGISSDLISRAADVCLKERRPLVVVLRETPLSSIHLQNMLTLSNAGGIILPAAPGFYNSPASIDDLVDFIVGKTLDATNIENDAYRRWMS